MKTLSFLLLSLLLLCAYIGYRIIHNPYEVEIDPQLIPGFVEGLIEHNHEFNQSKSLPIAAAAAFDLDNDQSHELFIGGGYFQQDALFKFKNGVFENITTSAGLLKDFGDTSYGAASIDVNRDGYSDLFIARDSGVYLYINNAGHLEKTKLDLPLNEESVPIAIALGDINNDGHIDMFVSCYINPAKFKKYGAFNDTRYGAQSLLMLNNGDNTFKQIGKDSKLAIQKNTLAATFLNLDRDRKIDLAVAYDAGHIGTFKNMGGNRFKKIPNPSSSHYAYPMGLAIGDYNNDGNIDIFSTNIGTTIPLFLARGDLRGNQFLNHKWMLLESNGDFSFTDSANKNNIASYELGRGAVMSDINLDGLQDLVVSTNFIDYLPHHAHRTPGKLLIQTEYDGFANTESQSKVLNPHFGSTPLIADFNDDGFPDIVHINIDGPTKVFFNQGGAHHFAKIILDEQPESIGAKVTLTSGTGKKRTDQFIVGEGFASDQSHHIILGLGFETSITKIEIEYTSGKTVLIENPKIDQTIRVSEFTPKSKAPDENQATPLDENISSDDWEEPDVSSDILQTD